MIRGIIINFVRGDYHIVLRKLPKVFRGKLSCKLESTLKYFGKYNKYVNNYSSQPLLGAAKVELSCDSAIPLLGICLEKTPICKDTCTPIYIAALFTIVRAWKQPKCPLTDECTKKM